MAPLELDLSIDYMFWLSVLGDILLLVIVAYVLLKLFRHFRAKKIEETPRAMIPMGMKDDEEEKEPERELTEREELRKRENELDKRWGELKRKKREELERKESDLERRKVEDMVDEERRRIEKPPQKSETSSRKDKLTTLLDEKRRVKMMMDSLEHRYEAGTINEKNFKKMLGNYQKQLVRLGTKIRKGKGVT